MIRYLRFADGAFLAGDTDTGRACYAYPSSPHATRAKRHPAAVATEMVKADTFRPTAPPRLAKKLADRDAAWLAVLRLRGLPVQTA